MNGACFLGKENSTCVGRCEIAQHVWRSMSSLESLGRKSRDSLAVQELGLGAFSAGARVQSLVWELTSHKHGSQGEGGDRKCS